jgi:release factor glutamine methyltransferase
VASNLAWGARELAGRHESARLDAEVLLAHALGRPRSYLYCHGDAPLADPVRDRYAALVARRSEGLPVAYLTGRREFWSLELEVSPSTLIPRPETELLVARVLERLPAVSRCRVADLGTGCGAVALAIARERPGWTVVAIDRSPSALAVARRNAERLTPGQVRLALGDWCDGLGPERFDAVVANPPYVAGGDPRLSAGDVAFEPREALIGGPDGLDAVRAIAAGAWAPLVPGGWLLLEHGATQAAAVRALLARSGYAETGTARDLAGKERVTEGRRPWGDSGQAPSVTPAGGRSP